jgi:hypothetical protein
LKLIIAEKNDAARQIAERLSTGKPKKDKVYNTAIYRFEWKGEECVTIGLAGHILAPDFCDSVLFDKKLGWYSVTEDGEMLPADMPDGLARPTTPSASRFLPTASPSRAGSSRVCPISPGHPSLSCRPRRNSSARSRTSPKSPTVSSSPRTSIARAS